MENQNYKTAFIPYALAAFLIGLIGGFSTLLGPAFVADVGLAYNNTTWTALAQAISTAACAPILGKLADVFGRKRTLLLGIGLFTLGNVLTALSNSLLFMLLARFIVGIGTAAIAPVILSFIVTEFPKDQVAKGFSAYMLISSISVVFGPTLGGMIISRWGWRTMIWDCVAICAAVWLVCALIRQRQVPASKALTGFDGWGAAWVVIFFGLVLCIPAFGQNFGWTSPVFLGLLIPGAVSLGGLLLAERRAKNPILPGRFIRRKTFLLSILALFLTQGLMQANMTNMIVFLQYTRPGSDTLSGYAISLLYLGMSLGAVLLGPLSDRREPKKILIFSLLLTGLGCGIMFLFSARTPLSLLMAALGILGLGLGGNGTIFLKVVLSGLPPEQAGAGTGTYGLFRDLAAPFGVAVLVPLFTNGITDLRQQGATAAQAAVQAVHTLTAVELLAVALGLVTVLFLPRIHNKGA